MASWPTNPEWLDLTTINSGKQYIAADGVTFSDFNALVNNILYLKNKGVKMPQEKSVAITSNGTRVVLPDEGRALSKVTILTDVPSQEPTGTFEVTENDTYDISGYKYVKVDVPQTGSGEQPQLYPPGISITGNTLNISNPTSNGNFVAGYKIYLNSVYFATVVTAPVDLDAQNIPGGDHQIAVKCYGTYFKDSDLSNVVTYHSLYTYDIVTSLIHVSGDDTNPNTIKEGESATLIFTAESGYTLPETIDVTGCTYTWEPATEMLDISNPVDNVSIGIAAEKVLKLTTPTNVTSDDSSVSWDAVENATEYEVVVDNASWGVCQPAVYDYTQDGDTVTIQTAPYTQDGDTVTIT